MENLIDNLICFPDPECMDAESVEHYLSADWYEINGIFLFCDYTTISAEHLMDESSVIDVLTDEEIANADIQKIDDCLKRFDETDGFYHA